jgi:tetratricopeptide (TPR) repeat protein
MDGKVQKKIRAADAKEVGMGNPARETYCHPNQNLFSLSPHLQCEKIIYLLMFARVSRTVKSRIEPFFWPEWKWIYCQNRGGGGNLFPVCDLVIGALSALLASNQPIALSNLVHEKTALSVSVPDRNDPLEQEYLRLLAEDDAAQAEVDQWIRESQGDPFFDSPMQEALLQGRIEKRLEGVRQAYEAFLQRHPNHARSRVAYGSFLNDLQEEEQAEAQWEKARELDPTNPAVWNNLANYYGHNGPAQKAFEYYEKAIELNPAQPVYYQNLATTVYMFRRQATNYYRLTVPEVLGKTMHLYQKALELDPEDFILASQIAQTYYGIPPAQTTDAEADRQAALVLTEKALAAWQYALKLARDDIERQGVLLHLARIQISQSQRPRRRVPPQKTPRPETSISPLLMRTC